MGVYIFRSRVADWVKVGHHRVTPRRPNVWYRVARRGFESCKGPAALRGNTNVEQLDLLKFYPNLTTKEEKRLHRENKDVRVGEWYPASMLPTLMRWLEESGGVAEAVGEMEKKEGIGVGKQIKLNGNNKYYFFLSYLVFFQRWVPSH